MMGLAGKYSCEPPPLDESSLQVELVKQNLHPSEYTQRLAEAKAHSLATKHSNEHGEDPQRDIPIYYLGSDTVVEIDDRILEKPKDEDDAKAMLRRLSGREVGARWEWTLHQHPVLTCNFCNLSTKFILELLSIASYQTPSYPYFSLLPKALMFSSQF